MEKREYKGLPTDLTPISPAKYAEIMGVTKATACNWARAFVDGKEGLPENVAKVERMGRAWLLYVPAEMVKNAIT